MTALAAAPTVADVAAALARARAQLTAGWCQHVPRVGDRCCLDTALLDAAGGNRLLYELTREVVATAADYGPGDGLNGDAQAIALRALNDRARCVDEVLDVLDRALRRVAA